MDKELLSILGRAAVAAGLYFLAGYWFLAYGAMTFEATSYTYGVLTVLAAWGGWKIWPRIF